MNFMKRLSLGSSTFVKGALLVGVAACFYVAWSWLESRDCSEGNDQEKKKTSKILALYEEKLRETKKNGGKYDEMNAGDKKLLLSKTGEGVSLCGDKNIMEDIQKLIDICKTDPDRVIELQCVDNKTQKIVPKFFKVNSNGDLVPVDNMT